MPVTLRFQSTGAVPGDGAPIVMRGPSLTIGRGSENDVVLPDPDRLISKNHCAIEDHDGEVTVIDFSTNGTFLNYGKNPLGRVPTPLNDGDVLSMGAYELIIAISSSGKNVDPLANLPPPIDEEQVSHGTAGSSPENLLDLLDDPGAQRADFLDDLMGGDAPLGPSQVVREDPIDSLMLPHVGDAEDPILGPIPDPLDDDGPGDSISSHSSSLSDSFRANKQAASVIPDDWDDDLLSPAPSAPAPKPAPPPVAEVRPAAPPPAPDVPKPVALPDDDDAESSPFSAPVASPSRLATSVVPPPPPLTRSKAPPPPAAAVPAPKPEVVAKPEPAPKPKVTAASGDAIAAAQAFFRGAGAEDIPIADGDVEATMERLGQVMATLIAGLREILMTRTSIKSEFRINQTMIGAGGNNPLKFSLSPEHAIEMIFKPKARGYQDGNTAVEEALKDIKAHEVAMVTGMEAAIKDVLGRLDPKTLEEKIGTGGGFADMLKGKKSRYWETYEKLYAEISEQAEHDFHEFFSKEFAKAYQKQLERLK